MKPDRSTSPRRSMLFVPASNASMLSNVYIYKPDAVMLDVEDGVAPREKDSARLMMFHALSSPAYQDLYTVVRINALDTPWGMLDLEAAVRGGADVIRLPMTHTAQNIIDLEREVERIERECGREVGSTRLQAAIESVAGVLNSVEIAKASPRMDSIALAAFDYVVDLQTTRGDGTELLFARQMILHAARNAGIDCYDAVYGDVNDEEGFLREVELAKKLGYNGKSLINPRQIEPLHNAYAPTESELAHAYLVVEAAERAEREGLGVVSLNGKMVDAPIIATARRTIAYADASGVRR